MRFSELLERVRELRGLGKLEWYELGKVFGDGVLGEEVLFDYLLDVGVGGSWGEGVGERLLSVMEREGMFWERFLLLCRELRERMESERDCIDSLYSPFRFPFEEERRDEDVQC